MKFAALLLLAALPGVLPAPLDSQVVLARYASALANLAVPKAEIFTYSVSQAGPSDIEQRHRIYRSGIEVRDETLELNGVPLRHKIVRISRRADAYAVSSLAPRADAYALLFLDAIRDGSHLDYVYQAMPLIRSATGFTVDRVTIDGETFLPRAIDFHSSGSAASGSGRIEFGPFGGHWMVASASVSAVVAGSIARERITFGDYRFPAMLPRSTFL
ncbi:MAG TPA: hypothetical protein VIN40_04960 [Candidatus Tyrphobacter sp.]